MPDVSFSGLAIVAAFAFAIPLVLGFAPRVRLPAVVIEIVAGIVIGPAGLGWVKPDLPIKILALIGLAFLLFLAGLEIEFDRLRGRVLKFTGLAFAVSFGIALLVAYGFKAAGQVQTPLIIAIILVATSLGIIIPLLKDTGQIQTDFGQLVVGAGSIAGFGAIILLTLFFSREAKGTASQVMLLASFVLLAVVVAFVIVRAERLSLISRTLLRLQDTTAQIRVRGAFVLLVLFAALAEKMGLEVILGAFIAGAILTLIDRDLMMTHPEFRLKLEAIGFGVFIPVFFINSGLNFKLAALFASPSTVARVPLLLLAILTVRGLPAFLYLPILGRRLSGVAGLLQATTLPFVVAASQIGVELRQITPATSAALIAAALLSVLIFPLVALTLMPKGEPAPQDVDARVPIEAGRPGMEKDTVAT
jgi:Kef-type K+ transport system membrane component KefB